MPTIAYGTNSRNSDTSNLKHISGKYDYEYQLGKVSFAEIDKAGDDLVEILIDPRMDKGMIKGVLDEFKNSVQTLKGEVRPLSDVGYNAHPRIRHA